MSYTKQAMGLKQLMEEKMNNHEMLIDTLLIGAAQTYEQNLADVTNLQQAVVEIYEMLIPPQPEV